MEDILGATKQHSGIEAQLVASLKVPDASPWFVDVFGADNGAKLAASYEKSKASLESYAKNLFEYCVKEGVNKVQIEQQGTPDHSTFSDKVITAMINPVPLYRVSFRWYGLERAMSENYVYMQGGFRRVPDDIFVVLPGMPSSLRIRLAENVLRPKVQVKPTTPSDPAGKPMRGKVLLRVLIDAKGDVKDVQLEKGDPILAQSASEAVRQWHFEPFTVFGQPIEVETKVSVHFP